MPRAEHPSLSSPPSLAQLSLLDRIALRARMAPGTLLSAKEAAAILPGDEATNRAWLAASVEAAGKLPSGAVYLWEDVLDAMGCPPADAVVTPEGPPSPVMTVQQAKARLHCGRTKLYALLSEGLIEAAPSPGKETLILASSVDEFLTKKATVKKERKRAPPKPARSAGERANAILEISVG